MEDENEITKIQRFGRKKENVNRPIRISVNTEKAKKKLFGKQYKLKNNEKFKQIRINHDMTENERNLTKQRIEEARQKTIELQQNSSLKSTKKDYIFLVQGPPWAQEIIKTKKRKQQANQNSL